MFQAQKQGHPVTFIDAEHAIDPEYAQALGVNMEELLLSQPNSGEEALDIAANLVRYCTAAVLHCVAL